MILTLTPNPALDVTYELDDISLHAENRVRRVRTAPGGKGVNVARVLAQLGVESVCAGPLGGGPGERLRTLLDQENAADGRARIHQAWTEIAAPTRSTLAVVDPEGATGLYEPGPPLTAEEVTALAGDLQTLLEGDPRPEAVTISGSLPGGVTADDLAELIGRCHRADRPVLVDTSGPAMLAAARAGADVLKPNADEALAATGRATPLEAARSLTELGARIVICSLGADGMIGVQSTDRGVRAWHAALPTPLSGNATGAGDAVVAALATTVLPGATDLPTALRRAVAVGASAVVRPIAGQIDPACLAEVEPTVVIEEIPCP